MSRYVNELVKILGLGKLIDRTKTKTKMNARMCISFTSTLLEVLPFLAKFAPPLSRVAVVEGVVGVVVVLLA